MTKNLETADRIVKLVLSASTILLFISGVIAGPFAWALVMLSICVLVIFLIRVGLRKSASEKRR